MNERNHKTCSLLLRLLLGSAVLLCSSLTMAQKITTSIDPASGKLTVQRSGAWIHPFLRPGSIGEEGTSEGIRQPYKESVWVRRAIDYVAGPICQAELVLTVDKRGGDTPLENPELTRFLESPAKKPRGPMSDRAFRWASVMWLQLKGECFWVLDDTWLSARSRKSPVILARPDQMREITDGAGNLVGWRFRHSRGREELLLPEQVIQTAFENPYSDYRGLAPWEAAAIATDSDYAAGKYARNLSRNNGDRGPFVTLGTGGMPSDEQIQQIERILREKRQRSRAGEFRAAFLAGDVKVEDPQLQAVDAAFVTQRLENRHEIFIAFGVPPSFAEVMASYSVGSASDRFKLIEETCMPIAGLLGESFEELCTKWLGRALDAPTVFAELSFDEHSTMQQVRSERMSTAKDMVDRGIPWKVVNDHLNLGLAEFPGWDIGRVPFNLTEIGVAEEETPATAPEDGQDGDDLEKTFGELRSLMAQRQTDIRSSSEPMADRASGAKDAPEAKAGEDSERAQLWRKLYHNQKPWEKKFRSRFGRILMTARRATLANLQEHFKATAGAEQKDGSAVELAFDLGEWVRELMDGITEISRSAIEAAGGQLLADLDQDGDFRLSKQEAIAFLSGRQNHLSNTGTDIWNEVRSELQSGLNEGETFDELSSRVRRTFTGIDKQRSDMIAATETTAAYGFARFQAMKQAGVKFKEWVSSGDDRVRHSHALLDGIAIGIDEHFITPNGEPILHPGQEGASPAEVINCRCILLAAAEENNPLEDQA